METDARLRELTLRKNVVLRYGRYRIESDALRVSLSPGKVEVQGDAKLALCPCPDPPVMIAASGGTIEAEGDVTLRFPRVEIFGVPVVALPWLWIRAPHQVGVLPPTVAWRGRDGLLIGSGVHVPWTDARGEPSVIEASIAGYIKGGADVSARLITPRSTAKVTWDWLRTSRVAVSAIGHSDPQDSAAAAVAWDIDAIRGERARSATVDLRSAALPYDTAAAETSIRAGDLGSGLSALAATGVVGRAWRGGQGLWGGRSPPESGGEASERDRAVAGPRAAFAMGGALTSRGTWDAFAEGALLGTDRGRGAIPIAGASLGAAITARPGPFEAVFGTRARARAAAPGEADPSLDASAGARVELAMPLARSFGGRAGEAPLVHVIAPSVEVRAAAALHRGDFFGSVSHADPSALWVAAAGASTSLGRYTGRALRADLRAGLLGSGEGVDIIAAHARAAAQGAWLSADIEAAAARAVAPDAPDAPDPPDPTDPPDPADPPDPSDTGGVSGASAPASTSGFALIARVRIGPPSGVSLRVGAAADLGAAAASSADPKSPSAASASISGRARAIADGAADSLPEGAGPLAYLAAPGWSATAELSIPWSRAVRSIARADVDLTQRRVLAIGGAVEITHPCGCLAVAATGAYREGRGGPDISLVIDIAPDGAPSPPPDPPRDPGAPAPTRVDRNLSASPRPR
jgi:hypothetical protein